MSKPILLIAESHNQTSYRTKCIELFRSKVVEWLTHNFDDIDRYFTLYFVSLEHGLLKYNSSREPYEISNTVNKKRIKKSINSLSVNSSTTVFSLLPSLYADHVLPFLKVDKIVKYSSYNFKQQLLKTPRSTRIEDQNVTHFRSGISTLKDLNTIINSRQRVGASLHYVSPTKNKDVFALLIDEAKYNRTFLDNGLITQVKNDGPLPNATDTLLRYMSIIEEYPFSAKNLSIVIPDNPVDQADAYDRIKQNADLIKRLACLSDVVCPIHRGHIYNKRLSYIDHVKSILEVLGWPKNFRIGIPTKYIEINDGVKKTLDSRVNLEELSQLLELNDPEGNPAITKVHFLAMSERTRPTNTYDSRINLCISAGLYDITCDACPINSVIGNQRLGTRVCDLIVRLHQTKVTYNSVMINPEFLSYDLEQENELGVLHSIIAKRVSDPNFIVEYFLATDELLTPDHDDLMDIIITADAFTRPANKGFDYLKKLYWLELISQIDVNWRGVGYQDGYLRSIGLKRFFSDESAPTPEGDLLFL